MLMVMQIQLESVWKDRLFEERSERVTTTTIGGSTANSMRRNYQDGLYGHNDEDNEALLNNSNEEEEEEDASVRQAGDGPHLQLPHQYHQSSQQQQQFYDGRKASGKAFHGGVASYGGFAASSSTSSLLTRTGMDASLGIPSTAAAVAASNSISNTTSTLAADPEMLFPNKLFVMLHDAHRQGFDDIVSWGRDSHGGGGGGGGGDPNATRRRGGGAQFKVHKKRDFEQVVLPKYFKMTKYKSFTRQLHNYAFLWVRTGSDKGGCKFTTTVHVHAIA